MLRDGKLWKMAGRYLVLVAALAIAAPGLSAQSADWTTPFPAHRIAGNLYYVGSKGLAGIERLMPEVTVEGEKLLLLTPQMAGVARRELGEPVGSLAHLRLDIIAAIDLLITGI